VSRAAIPLLSPMRGRYLVRNRALNAVLSATDALLGAVTGSRPAPLAIPRRVLLAVGGQLGDAVIATAALAELRRRLPGADIGVVAPSWSVPVLAGQPGVRWTHSVDHWRQDRSPRSIAAKAARYVKSFGAALGSIRAVEYDLAIDLYPYFPNMSWLLKRAGIPARAGFTSGGSGALYTHPMNWIDDRAHMAVQQRRLMDMVVELPTSDPRADPPRAALAPTSSHDRLAVVAKLSAAGFASTDSYIVVHAGSGARAKEWPVASWRTLAKRLADQGERIVFTGAGALEEAAARAIADNVSGSSNLVGRLSWGQFVEVIRRARLVISADTVAGHVAAAVDTPCVTLFSGISDLREWQPLGSKARPLIHAVPCAPCFQNNGCATMMCVRGITPETVAGEAMDLLRNRS
jgi:ADP-heptose:LPS heptosyltransferase